MTTRDLTTCIVLTLSTAVTAASAAEGPAVAGRASGRASGAAADSTESMTLRGGESSTVFGTLTVEGEDRIRIAFERPTLDIELDPLSVGGLEWVDPEHVVDRTPVDLVDPFLASTSTDRLGFAPRPWLMRLPTGPVARFRPEVSGVDRWSLIVVDSRGTTVARFAGDGKPPKEIAWDGASMDGTFAMPGLTYSHQLEAFDEAGNKRSFAGEAFELPAYAVDEGHRVTVLVPGRELANLAAETGDRSVPPAILLEAATYLNDVASPKGPVRVTATARSFDRANTLATRVATEMSRLLLGDPLRIQPVADVQPDSPEAGSISIAVEG